MSKLEAIVRLSELIQVHLHGRPENACEDSLHEELNALVMVRDALIGERFPDLELEVLTADND